MMPEQSDTAEPRGSKRAFITTLAILMCWLAGLGVLSQRAERTVVNQRHIRSADCVVIAVPLDLAKKHIRIRQTIAGKPFDETVITVGNLDEAPVVAGREYVLALGKDGRIVKVSNPNKKGSGHPVVYPNSEDVIEQVRRTLAMGPIRE